MRSRTMIYHDNIFFLFIMCLCYTGEGHCVYAFHLRSMSLGVVDTKHDVIETIFKRTESVITYTYSLYRIVKYTILGMLMLTLQ